VSKRNNYLAQLQQRREEVARAARTPHSGHEAENPEGETTEEREAERRPNIFRKQSRPPYV
jgi:hypothetical protein